MNCECLTFQSGKQVICDKCYNASITNRQNVIEKRIENLYDEKANLQQLQYQLLPNNPSNIVLSKVIKEIDMLLYDFLEWKNELR